VQARLATEEDRCYLPLEDLKTEAGEFVCSDRSHSGCFLPLDPPFAEKATMGGIMATNSSGPRRLLYGLPSDLLLGVRFVTPKGEIIGAGGKTVKNVSGYDISKLMIGAMGSLGILCEMTLRLLPLPETMETLVFTFDSFSDASAFASAVFGTKLLPAALEVADRAVLDQHGFRASEDLQPGRLCAMVALEAFDEAVTRMSRELQAMARLFKAVGHALLREDKHRLFWLHSGGTSDHIGRAGSSPCGAPAQLPSVFLEGDLRACRQDPVTNRVEAHAALSLGQRGCPDQHSPERQWDQDGSMIDAVTTLLAHAGRQAETWSWKEHPLTSKEPFQFGASRVRIFP
jgi:FAD/FMN-containing dehydrogenase